MSDGCAFLFFVCSGLICTHGLLFVPNQREGSRGNKEKTARWAVFSKFLRPKQGETEAKQCFARGSTMRRRWVALCSSELAKPTRVTSDQASSQANSEKDVSDRKRPSLFSFAAVCVVPAASCLSRRNVRDECAAQRSSATGRAQCDYATRLCQVGQTVAACGRAGVLADHVTAVPENPIKKAGLTPAFFFNYSRLICLSTPSPRR